MSDRSPPVPSGFTHLVPLIRDQGALFVLIVAIVRDLHTRRLVDAEGIARFLEENIVGKEVEGEPLSKSPMIVEALFLLHQFAKEGASIPTPR